MEVEQEEEVVLCRICEVPFAKAKLPKHSVDCVNRNKWEIRKMGKELQLYELEQDIQKQITTRQEEREPLEEDKKRLDCLDDLQTLLQDYIQRGAKAEGEEECKKAIQNIEMHSKSLEQTLQQAHQILSLVKKKKKAMLCMKSSSGVSIIPTVDDFENIKPITKGGFGKVFLVRKKKTGDLFAMKIIPKEEIEKKNQIKYILNERNILASTLCPFIVRMYFAFQTKDHVCLIMEYCSGGDLFSMLSEIGELEEETAKIYIIQIILAVRYLHSKNIIHRDLKPDNILISSTGHIKLTDFGLSHYGTNQTPPTRKKKPKEVAQSEFSVVGTPDYMAPEVIQRLHQGEEVDWWGVGLLLYEMLVGRNPFSYTIQDSSDDFEIDDIFTRILCCDIDYPDDLSPTAKDLISKLLKSNPKERLTFDKIKAHPFFTGCPFTESAILELTPPFIPNRSDDLDTSYFDARKMYWSSFVLGSESEYQLDNSNRTQLNSFWFINGQNLKLINDELSKQ